LTDSPAPGISAFPNLSRIVESVIAVWPEHRSFLSQRLDEAALASSPIVEEACSVILTLHGDALETFAADYRWTCETLLQEEIYFRRNGQYRNSRFEEVNRSVYGNAAYMTRYLNGLLLSQVLWANQAQSLHFFVDNFLVRFDGGSLLEIGPGHGLLMYFAARSARFSNILGWDVSQTSASVTRSNLLKLELSENVHIENVDVFKVDKAPFADAIVLSELLEHVEDPVAFLKAAGRLLRRNGRVFINIPINSPAPDHIFLWRSPEAVFDSIELAGFHVEQHWLAPATGYSVERAQKRCVTINVVMVATQALTDRS